MTTSTQASTVTPEELGFLVSGPGRASEVALARLLDAGLIRISRQGLVSAVETPGNGATPLEAQMLASLRISPQNLDVITKTTAYSPATESLRQHLLARRLIGKPRKGALYPWAWIIAILTFVIGLGADNFLPYLLVAVAVAVLGVVFLRRKGHLTGAGKRVVKRAAALDRVTAVAVYGLRGKIFNQPVYAMFGLTASVVGMLPVRRIKKRVREDTGVGSCGTSCGSSCSSCSSASSCSSSSSSCSSSSCSSSSSSSCSSSSCSSSSSSCSSSSSSD
ncbi:TIGR04222 domain-containing membrane protein [Lentzea tibetensis]|uniref:TIGR04222 domain-containing membrane protein n=1 Tax=Lentzea tibetensis TaxID=2591470 RepID=A0A563ELU7_9PSEU|nr:TIGR04222 domain-containing membrane protein [Lentzea tibetensis]TWP48125.1 TIGR04222 domain-containing membrane protein [Lentzea tibetensis]